MSIDNIVFCVSFSGLILAIIGSIYFRSLFFTKKVSIIIDELHKNLYNDIADAFQKLLIVHSGRGYLPISYWGFTNKGKLYREITNLFLELSISPEKTKLYYYQRSLKVSLLLCRLGIIIVILSIFFRFFYK